jgi:hypothetical protein
VTGLLQQQGRQDWRAPKDQKDCCAKLSPLDKTPDT